MAFRLGAVSHCARETHTPLWRKKNPEGWVAKTISCPNFFICNKSNCNPSSDHRREDFFVRVTETNNAYLCRTEIVIKKVWSRGLKTPLPFPYKWEENFSLNLCRTENLMSKVMLKALHLTDTSEEKDIQNKYVVHKFHFTFLCSTTNIFME